MIRKGMAAIPDDYLLEAFMCTKQLSSGDQCLIGTLSKLINGELPAELGRIRRVATKFKVDEYAIVRIFYGVMDIHELALIEELIADRLDKVIGWNLYQNVHKIFGLMEKDNAPSTN